MDHFEYRNGVLHAEDVSVEALARDVGTPFYAYSTATLTRHYTLFDAAFASRRHRVCYAVKANSNLGVLATLARLGAGADVVSEGEVRRAVAAGITPSEIVFSGVGKTAEEMRHALALGIFQFNVESEPELRMLSAMAQELGKTAPIAVRVNPDVGGAGRYAKISTGGKENKFGVDLTIARGLYALARTLPGIRVQGVSMHIGSQFLSLAPLAAALTRLMAFVAELRDLGITLEVLDVGGGLGVPYFGGEEPPGIDEYAAVILGATEGFEGLLLLEPGRVIVGNAGILVSRVVHVKQGEAKRFLILDAAMNDLIRPSLYDAFHTIVPVHEATGGESLPVDIVGPVCESSDIFAENRIMPPLVAGDLVAFRTAGAYGAVMASSYNTRPLTPEVLIRGDAWATVRERPTYAQMLDAERIPAWLD